MDKIKKLLIVLIVIVLLEGIAIINLHQICNMSADMIETLANRGIVTSNLIYSLQKQISQK